MKKFIVIVGLPGSGKTFLGEKLAKELDGVLLDDICVNYGKNYLKCLKGLFESKIIIITEPSLCYPENRLLAEELLEKYHAGDEVEWLFFENNRKKCWKNIQYRNDERNISSHSVYNLSKQYKIPEGAKFIKIWQKDV